MTGPAIEEVFQELSGTGFQPVSPAKMQLKKLAGWKPAPLHCARRLSFPRPVQPAPSRRAIILKKQHPELKIVATEALQCPTLLMNGFGDHRIEGIGDKHIPWVHNVRNTDAVAAIDDEDCMRILRLFNEPAGRE